MSLSAASIDCIAAITVRNIDEETKRRLRVRAAEHGRSMEAELRAILQREFGTGAERVGLGTRIRSRFEDLGGVDLDLPERNASPRVPDFELE